MRPSTQQTYLRSLHGLCTWLGLARLPTWSAAEWDDALLQYLHDEFEAGARPHGAAKLLSALLWARPGLGRPLRVVLPRSSRALLGWKRRQPGQSRPPLPWIVLCGVLEILLMRGQRFMACALALMFHCYLRPGELLALRGFQLVPPAPGLSGGFRWWTLLLHPEELQTPSKTGELDDSLPLDVPELQWLTPLLLELRATVKPLEPLWSFDYVQLRAEFEGALAALGLRHLGATLYSLRHGGASHDRIVNRRSLEEVAKRGRWRARLSVRRYEKHGRLALQVAQVPGVVQQRLRLSAQRLPGLFARASAPRSAESGLGARESRWRSSPAPGGWPPPSARAGSPRSSGTSFEARCLTSPGQPSSRR